MRKCVLKFSLSLLIYSNYLSKFAHLYLFFPVVPAKPSPKVYTLTGNRRKIRLKERNAKCSHLNKIDLKRDFAAGVNLSEAQNPISPLAHSMRVYDIIIHCGVGDWELEGWTGGAAGHAEHAGRAGEGVPQGDWEGVPRKRSRPERR